MRRKLFARVFLAVMLLLGAQSFFLLPQKAQASSADMGCVFPNVLNKRATEISYVVSTTALSLQLSNSEINSTSAKIQVNYSLYHDTGSGDANCPGPNPDGVKDSNNNNVFDGGALGGLFGGGDHLGDWSSILNNGGEISTKKGMFLAIGTSHGQELNIDYVKNPVTFKIDQIPADKSAEGYASSKNLGWVLWGLNPAAWFANNTNNSVAFTVSGLLPGKTYYAQVIISEGANTSDYSSNKTAFSTPVAFTTLETTDPNANKPLDVTTVPTDSPDTIAPIDTSLNNPFLVGLKTNCNILGGWSSCFVELFFTVFVSMSNWLAKICGYLFDSFAAISLSSGLYGGSLASWVSNAWVTVRDIANVFFIFLLLYTSLGLVLSIHSIDAKKLIAKIVIVALLINFSLFFCRVLVDTSNILSRVFYNAMNIPVASTPNTNSGINEQHISAAILQGVQPQKILSQNSYDALTKSNVPVGPGTIFIVFLMGFIMNLVLAYVFFMSAAFFAGRIAVIWFSMIFAPLAFVSGIVPGLDKNLKQIGWSGWLSGFLKACFNAPIFFFFMYLIVQLAAPSNGQGGLLSSIAGITQNNIIFTTSHPIGIAEFLVAIMVPTMILLGLLLGAKKIAEEMAGEFGGAMVAAIAGTIAVAGIAVAGGAAFAGRQFGSNVKLAGNDAARADLKDKMEKKSWYNPTKYSDKIKLRTAESAPMKRLGESANKAQEKHDTTVHAKHELEDYTTKRYGKDKKFEDLTVTQRNDVLTDINKDNHAEKTYGKNYKGLKDVEKADVDNQVKQEAQNATALKKHGVTYAAASAAQKGDVDADIAAKKHHAGGEAQHHVEHAKQELSMKENVMKSVRTGSYDVRNLSKIKAGISGKGIAAIAMAVRAGFKAVGVDHKESDKTGTTDIKNMFASLANIATKAAGRSGKEVPHATPHKEDDHGGGGGHGH